MKQTKQIEILWKQCWCRDNVIHKWLLNSFWQFLKRKRYKDCQDSSVTQREILFVMLLEEISRIRVVCPVCSWLALSSLAWRPWFISSRLGFHLFWVLACTFGSWEFSVEKAPSSTFMMQDFLLYQTKLKPKFHMLLSPTLPSSSRLAQTF